MVPALRHNRERSRLTSGALGLIGTPSGGRTGTGTTATTLLNPAAGMVLLGLAAGDMVAAAVAMAAVGTVAADTSALTVEHRPMCLSRSSGVSGRAGQITRPFGRDAAQS